MKPITFLCEALFLKKPEDIASQILDLSKWPEFDGYGPLPGIKRAEFETKTNEVIGTRIRVTNRDGSTHIEEIVEWEPTQRLHLHLHLHLHMNEFSPPVSRLAKGFDETWEFQITDNGTKVVRSFELHPKSMLARPLLWMISLIMKSAIARHPTSMQQQVENHS